MLAGGRGVFIEGEDCRMARGNVRYFFQLLQSVYSYIRSGRINKVALHNYIDFFDFSGLRLDAAFRRVSKIVERNKFPTFSYRRLCAKLYLKAETQQVDRILEEFSRRYWDCNPGGVYGSASQFEPCL